MPAPFQTKFTASVGKCTVVTFANVWTCRESFLEQIAIRLLRTVSQNDAEFSNIVYNLRQRYADDGSEYEDDDYSGRCTTKQLISYAVRDMWKDVSILVSCCDMQNRATTLSFMEELLSRYNHKATIESVDVEGAFNTKSSHLLITSDDATALAVAWWTVLIDRMVSASNGEDKSILDLITNSDPYNDFIWFSADDKKHHKDLWCHPEEEPNIGMWIVSLKGPIFISLNNDNYVNHALGMREMQRILATDEMKEIIARM